ncbi:peptidoglycan-associated lipoprotein Pal [Fontimonas thermophila]|nr:peptidoglycan-associated lipoprotein Pal [Fontimonas thermophila]
MASKTLPCVLLLLAASLTGCASTRDQSAATTPAGSTSAVATGPATGAVELSSDSALPPGVQNTVVYFAFDSDEISADAQQTIEAWARYLSANSAVHVRLEGHADERGTTEYNQALGERRANAVRRALINLGVPAGQLSVVSYGETRPAVQGHDESAWSKNRRVEFVR